MLTAVVVTHFDHIGEISVDAERNIRSLRGEGVQFLNQSVLLAKANDNPEIATFANCHQIGVRPYYLFQARPVKAASHFQAPLDANERLRVASLNVSRVSEKDIQIYHVALFRKNRDPRSWR
ncbi:hypothetical protein [Bradyrhizobium sp. 197]|uniref:hypothetical protein n=1 Tax=Bradyrhizobium sp. 197 TaxID=2782663 RepID=UPI001FF77B33|nr:hypothetical protein [Bradyrhizobium sp. 197]